jgi:ribonuclease R
VHITELGGEYFRFDEARQELRGERTGIRYTVGARVRVQVSRVDLDGRKIDFRMVREGEAERLLSRGMREKGARVEGKAVDELEALKKADREVRGKARRSGGAAGRSGTRTGSRSATSPAKSARKRRR